MKALIIDDEIHCVNTLEKMLDKYTEVKLVKSFTNPVEAMKEIKNIDADILFLDIEMPFMNGFELLQVFHPYPWKVIFTTAYHEYAIKAFKVNAVDYLLKPIPKDDLLKAIEQCKKKNIKQIQEKIEDSLRYGLNSMIQKIAIPTLAGLELISPKDILFLESDSNYTKIVMLDKEEFLVSKTMKIFEEMLEPYGFIRIHHSNIVNPRFIKRYIKGDGGYVILETGEHLNVSRSRKDYLLNFLRNPSLGI